MGLLQDIEVNDKKKLFQSNDNSVYYATGVPPLDYANGFWQENYNEKGEVSYTPIVGIRGGSFTTIIGTTGTGKSTFAIQAGFNIIKNFENGILIHTDAEKTMTKPRIARITGADIGDPRIILKKDATTIEDVLEQVSVICQSKEAGGNTYKYTVDVPGVNGKPFKAYVPTVIVIDSLPAFKSKRMAFDSTAKGSKDSATDDLGTNMDGARDAGDITKFFYNCLDRMEKYNITILVVNHIRTKIEVDRFKVAPKGIMMLGQGEHLPGGGAAQFYSQNYFRINMSKSTMYDKDDVGFEGSRASIVVAKTKTNFIGSSVFVAFNKDIGFDPIFSLYEFGHSIGLIQGRNPNLYFEGLENLKFSRKKFRSKFINETEFREGVLNTLKPYLEALLGSKELSDEEKVRYGDLFTEEEAKIEKALKKGA